MATAQQQQAMRAGERMLQALVEELRRQIRERRLTYSEIEARCGLSRPAIRKILQGDNGVSLYNLGRLLHALEVSHWLGDVQGFVFFIPGGETSGKQA